MAKNIDSVRQRILQTAKQLILRQGYRKTTIRQIVQESGITSGSIYHLFPNKDKIFWALVQEILSRTVRMVTNNFAEETPEFRYAAILEVELTAIARSAAIQEIYYESYTQPDTFEQVVERSLNLQREILPARFVAGDEITRHGQVLLLRGAMFGYIMSFELERTIDPTHTRLAILQLALQQLGLQAEESSRLAQRLEDMQDRWFAIAQAILNAAFDAEPGAAASPHEGRP